MDTVETPIATPATTLTIVNCLKGGMGNQLFQHVFAHSLARKLGAQVLSDISYFGNDPYGRRSVLSTLAPHAPTSELARHLGPGAYLLRDGNVRSLQDPLNLPADSRVLALDGYWQDEKLLDAGVVAETYAALADSQREVAASATAQEIAGCDNAVAVHLRRHDYGHMGMCEESYYVGALDFIRQRFPDARLFVFSDEPNFAKAFLGPRNPGMTMVPPGTDVGDLYLMSLCRHFVIANSTYSWWAARFGEAKGGLVICPQEWVTMDGAASPCPARWLQVPNAVRPMQADAARSAAVLQSLQRTAQGQTLRQWLADHGPDRLRLDFPSLNTHSVVVDLGARHGDWVQQMHARYQPRLYAHEPDASTRLAGRFTGQPTIKTAIGALPPLQAWLAADGIDRIDVLKINLDGECALIEQLIDSGFIARIGTLHAQFHDSARRDAIARRLAATHRCAWAYAGICEAWERIQ
jgi:hypothetical protein